MAEPRPGRGEVVVRVEGVANPINVKRAGAYSQRLPKLKGAGEFPSVLGNDIAGVVESVGAGFDPSPTAVSIEFHNLEFMRLNVVR